MPIRPRQRQHLHSRSSCTRRRTRSAPTAAAVAAAHPATAQQPQQQPQQQQQPQAAAGGGVQQPSVVNSGWLAAVGEAEADVEAPTRGAAAPGEAVSDSLGSANRQSRQQGGGGARTSLYPVRRRREVRGTSRCTQARVSFAGPVPR